MYEEEPKAFILFIPIIYLFSWILGLGLANWFLGIDVVKQPIFLIISALMFLLGNIAKSTNWFLGMKHDQDNKWSFGFGADSLGRYLEFHGGGKFPWDYKIYTNTDEKSLDKLNKSEDSLTKSNLDLANKS